MKLTFHCPACQSMNRTKVTDDQRTLQCTECQFVRSIPESDWTNGRPTACAVCGNPDLWRQKDFPQWLGLLMVALGAILSSIAWYFHRPIAALSILAGFGLLDMILYQVMPDALVCYRCRSRHHVAEADDAFSAYDHELGERYRQERLRLEEQQAESSLGS